MNNLHKGLSLFLFIFCLNFSQKLFSQTPASPIDSLKQVLHSAEKDTARVKTLNAIVQQFIQQENYDSALKYCSESILLSQKLGYTKGLSAAFTNRGNISNDQGNYPGALKDYEEALKIYRESGDKKNVANLYNLIANACHMHGDFPNALKNQYAALKIREEINDEQGIAWSYNNIGTIYRIQGDYASALKNYFETLKLLEKFGDQKMIALAHNNIGNVYTLQGKHTEALKSYISSLKIRQATGDKKDIIASYFNIGDAFCDLFEKDTLTNEVSVDLTGNDVHTIPRKNWLDTAMTIQLKAHVMNEELGNKYYSIFSLSGMGRTSFLRKNYSESIRLYTKAYAIAEEMEALDLQKEIAKYLADNYNRLKDFRNEINWYMKFTAHKDSLFNKIKSEDLTRTRLNYEFEKKEDEARAKQDKKDALAKAELDREKKMRNIFLGGFAIVLIFAGIFFYQRNNIRKEKAKSDKSYDDLKKAQGFLIQSEKMASLGQLTAGLAHEINNPINFVSANVKPLKRNYDELVDFVLKKKELNEEDLNYNIVESKQLFSGIEEGAHRTTTIVKGLRNFSRLDENDLKKANINEGIESTLMLLLNVLNTRKVEVIKSLEDIPKIKCYPGQLNQVFMNVITNAIEAIGENGKITIRTLKENDKIKISISDTGKGMNNEVKQKIFDPFFTTKDVGKGTGLGLSISYGIIEKHNGKIEVKSEINKGSEFIITLPVI